jgi:lysophospholipase L1-like esterase
MKNSMRFRLGLVLALAALLAGCEGPCSKIATINAPALDANGVDLTTYVAVGTSLSAGYESGGIVDRHQVHSFPALFAQQIGKTVTIPGGGGTFTHGRTQGAPTNFTQNSAYHNLGIPGAILFDLVDSSFYHSAPPQLRQSFVMFDIIQRRRGTVLQQALSLSPTLMSLEYGANELLGPATQGSAPSSTAGADFTNLLAASLDAIHAASPNTRVAVFNVPDVTSIPYFTTFPAFTVSTTTGQPVPLVGVNGPCQLGDLITLPASAAIAAGTGIPAGGFNYLNPAAGSNGQPLPEALILRAAEVAVAKTQVAEMNAAVDHEATRSYVAKVDIHDLLVDIARNGIQLGGNLYTSDFITGGLFSLDGVHPNDLGYALMANQLIDGVNARFGSRIPRLNPLDHATTNASSLRPATKGPAYPTRIDGLQESFETYFPH